MKNLKDSRKVEPKKASSVLTKLIYKESQDGADIFIIEAFDPDKEWPAGWLSEKWVGRIVLDADAPVVYVHDLDVLEEYRRQGIALSLYHRAIALAKRKGFRVFQQGDPRTDDAAGVWGKLAQTYKVEQNEQGDYINL